MVEEIKRLMVIAYIKDEGSNLTSLNTILTKLVVSCSSLKLMWKLVLLLGLVLGILCKGCLNVP
jgi:hypothetical protein